MTTTSPGRTRTRAIGVLAAALAPLVVWAVAVPLLGIDLGITTPAGVQPVGPAVTFGFALVSALLGWAVLAVLERVTARALTIWTIGATALLLASFVPPVTAAVTTAGAVVLILMHVAVAAALIPAMRARR